MKAANNPEDDGTFESLFRQAVEAIDAGDADRLEKILNVHPHLACERLRSPGGWLRDQIGGALDSFFRDPYLLWFVSEDAVRNNFLPVEYCSHCRNYHTKSKIRKGIKPAGTIGLYTQTGVLVMGSAEMQCPIRADDPADQRRRRHRWNFQIKPW